MHMGINQVLRRRLGQVHLVSQDVPMPSGKEERVKQEFCLWKARTSGPQLFSEVTDRCYVAESSDS